MADVALQPLNTRLVRATVERDGQTFTYQSIDVDRIAATVFAAVDATDTDAKADIAAKLVEALAAWTGEPGTAEEFDAAKRDLTAELSRSLTSVDARELPLRRFPFPPVVHVAAAPAPLPESPTIADARKWVLTWEALSPESDADTIYTELSSRPGPALESIEATAFERALLAFDGSVTAIASAPIEKVTVPLPTLPAGPPSGSAILDFTESTGVRAVLVRNAGLPAGFVYAVETQSEVLARAIDRDEEIVAKSLEDITALNPSRVEVWFEGGQPAIRLPVVLILEQFDADLVTQAMAEWRRQTEAPPDGEFLFDVTAARLRLKRVLLRN